MPPLDISSWRKSHLFVVFIIFELVLIALYYNNLDSALVKLDSPFNILLWGKFYQWDHIWMNSIVKGYCDSEFGFTSDKRHLASVDAIFFHLHNNNNMQSSLLPTVASGRDPNIPLIFLLTESSIYYPFDTHFSSRKDWDGVFNWSYSIYTDSEFYDMPLKVLYHKLKQPDMRWVYGSDFSQEFLQEKNKTAMWVVSNCGAVHSNRQQLKDSLVNLGIEIDTFGNCGEQPCDGDCFLKLGPQYRFYLAFENSICLDYITEKIQNGLASGMIPVVFGMGNLSLHAPPNSYIDVMDFGSVEELAERLKFLEGNASEYFKYFEWRQTYELPPLYVASPYTSVYKEAYGILFCDMLRQVRERTLKIRKPGGERFRNIYENVGEWYTNFYNDKFKRSCPRCLPLESVEIENPSWLRHQILNNESLCIT